MAADVDAQPTNLGTKTDVFTLPTQGAQGSTITWTVKSGTAVVIVDNVVTEVIRPAADGEDAVVVLEATFTLGEEEPVTVEVTVTIAKEAEAGELVLAYEFDFESPHSNQYNVQLRNTPTKSIIPK